ncbi:twin-arginine translocase TatA/TatE family subunit [Novipirellula maiorica]|nr:twin-arginine translocase TatA/TatE family subunit [Rhodopirellula maiorica]
MSDSPLSKYASIRDGFAAIRELIIVLAMLALLFAPSAIREILSDAGIRSFAGVEFDEQTLDEVETAHSRVAELEQQLAVAQQQIDSMSQSSVVRADPRFGTVSKMIADAQQYASQTEDDLREVKEKHVELWKRAGRPPRTRHSTVTTESDRPAEQQALLSPSEPLSR